MARKRPSPTDPKEWLRHDIARLLTLLHRGGVKIPMYVRRARRLTRFAVETRYPGLSGPVTDKQYRGTRRIAEGVLRWAERQLTRP